MMRWLLLAALLTAAPGFGRDRQLAQIDDYCSGVDAALVSATPFLFTGPDPWEEAEDLDDDDSEALAYVYTVGPQIRRVFIQVANEDDGWREDILYFFSPSGDLVKRLRTLDSPAANISLETVAYYKDGELLKESSHHHSLAHGHRDSSKFIDPGAPVFWTTDELPFSDMIDVWRGLI
jgi:hypothetical protein